MKKNNYYRSIFRDIKQTKGKIFSIFVMIMLASMEMCIRDRDTHVQRVSNRIGLAASKDVLNTEKDLRKNLPKEKWSKLHHQIIAHGRKICKARNPLCEEMCIRDSWRSCFNRWGLCYNSSLRRYFRFENK